MVKKIAITSIFIILLGICIAGYFIFLNGSLPERSDFTVDFDKVRELAHADSTELPVQINYLRIATGELPGWGTVAGDFGSSYKIEFPSFQLVYENKTAIIEAPYNKRLFDKFPYGKEFNQSNYEIMQLALMEADFIIPTHEHWDHIGGVAQSKYLNQILPKTILTKEQINGPTIVDAEFPEHAFDHYRPIEYGQYFRAAPGVVLIKAPGHSVGHQFVFVKLRNGSEFLFTGDVVWVTANLKQQKSRPWLASKKRLENREQIAHQIRWLHDEFYANAKPKIIMVTTHDPEQHKKYIGEGLIHDGFKLINSERKNTMYSVEIVKKEEKKVVGLALHTTFKGNRQAEEIPPFFHKVMEDGTLENVPNRSNTNQLCAIVKEQTSPDFDYYMGVETTGFDNVPDGMKTLDIPANRYAVTSFVKRGNADVLKAFKYLTDQWIPENGYTQDLETPLFIYYDHRFIPIYKDKGYAGNPVAEIYIPIK
jgi:predicted transcriptional regulator YdeE